MLALNTVPQLALGGDISNSPTFFAYRTTCIILLRRTFLNKQCIALDYYRILYSLFIYMFIHDIQHPYTLVRPIRQGLKCTP